MPLPSLVSNRYQSIYYVVAMSSPMSGLRGFRLLHLRTSVRQPVRAVLVIAALAAGVALTVGAGVLVSSIDNSYKVVMRSLAGPTDLRVVGGARDQAWLSPDDLSRIESVRGVAF